MSRRCTHKCVVRGDGLTIVVRTRERTRRVETVVGRVFPARTPRLAEYVRRERVVGPGREERHTARMKPRSAQSIWNDTFKEWQRTLGPVIRTQDLRHAQPFSGRPGERTQVHAFPCWLS